jgi:hypothetical protein
MKRTALCGLLTGLLMIAVGATSAQSTVDASTVDTLAAAVAATLAQSSLHGEAQTYSEASSPDGSAAGVTQQTVQSFDLVAAGNTWNLVGMTTSTSATPMGTLESTTDMVVLDGVTYLRLTNTGGDTNMGLSGVAPEGWFTLDSLVSESGGQGRFGGIGTTSFVERALGPLNLPLTTNSVTAVGDLADDAIGGQAMRVVQITVDSQALLDSPASALLSQGGFGMGGPGMGSGPALGNGAPGAAPDGSMPQPMGTPPAGMPNGQPPQGAPGAMTTLTAQDVRLTFALYIGRDDGLVHRIYSVLDQGSGDGAFSQRVTSLVDFSGFGAPITITAPDVSA